MTKEEFAAIGTLHELLELAIRDGRAVLTDDRYVPDYAFYHEPYKPPGTARESPTCYVCLAGAVMSLSLGADPAAMRMPIDYGAEGAVRLRALDFLRQGLVHTAASLFYGTCDRRTGTVGRTKYPLPARPKFSDRSGFREHLDSLEALHAQLEEQQL